MAWFRKRNGRRIPAGIALVATLLHVFFLSLHVAASATFALAGAQAGQQPAFVICGPAQSFHAALGRTALEQTPLGGPALDDVPDASDGTPAGGSEAQTLACPYCTSAAAAPAALLPDLPAEPAYRSLDAAPPPLPLNAAATPQHGLSEKRSRAPPVLA